MTLNTVTATDARVHFGELLQRIVQNGEAVMVERSGKPVAVIMPVEQYDRMRTQEHEPDWRDLLQDAQDHIRAALGDQALIPADEIVRMGREVRDAEQIGLR